MTIKEKSVSATDNALKDLQGNSKPKPPTKQEVALLALLRASTEGLNTLEANQLYGDTCLHTMISIFRNQYNLMISGTRETITNRAGTLVHPYRYRLTEPNSVKTAKKLIKIWRKKRSALPVFNSK